ncbi:thioredoxin family protein [bacterium]|nr:thioredoxin family protein [bacterium]
MERLAEGLKLKLGNPAPYFSLKATDGRVYSLADFANKQVLVTIFTCNHCPYAQAYETRLVELARFYQPRGVQFIAICANNADAYPEDSFEKMVEKAKALALPYPYLQDVDQNVAKAYDAQCTPEVYMFNAERKLIYHGRIDDNYQEPEKVTVHSLRDALDAVLSGEAPNPALTSAVGCSIKWK